MSLKTLVLQGSEMHISCFLKSLLALFSVITSKKVLLQQSGTRPSLPACDQHSVSIFNEGNFASNATDLNTLVKYLGLR